MKQPIIFFGASAYGIPTLEYLNDHYTLSLIVTTEKNSQDAIPRYCELHRLSYISVDTLKSPAVVAMIKAFNAPVAVLAHFGLIVPKSIIDLFPKGIVNIHPSLLPAYRGPTPGTSALLAGETMSGVSIMLLDTKVDHGPVLAQEKEPMLPMDTSITFYTRAFTKGATMLATILPGYLEGTIHPQEQDHEKATFTNMMTRDSGYFDAMNPPDAQTLDRMIRAYHPWPGVWTKVTDPTLPLCGKIIKFLPDIRSPLAEALQKTFDGAGASQYLIQPEGKKAMPIKDFLNGYPQLKMWVEHLLPQK